VTVSNDIEFGSSGFRTNEIWTGTSEPKN